MANMRGIINIVNSHVSPADDWFLLPTLTHHRTAKIQFHTCSNSQLLQWNLLKLKKQTFLNLLLQKTHHKCASLEHLFQLPSQIQQ